MLSATHMYGLYRPSRCDLRVYLRHKGEPEAEPSPFAEVLEELGRRHESNHLATLGPYQDLSAGSLEERAARTERAVADGAPVLYQPVLIASAPKGFIEDRIVGIPDFMMATGEGYAIRDCKLSRHANEGAHPEILRQVELYGWLYAATFDSPPAELQVVLGDSSVVSVPYDSGQRALEVLQEISDTMSRDDEPYSPVGWSKCQDCGFRDRCWTRALDSQDVAVLPGLDQGAARALREQGIVSVPELMERYDATSLSELKRPRGQQMVRVGKVAESIIRHGRVFLSGEPKRFAPLTLPAPPVAVFDVEAMPPFLDEIDKVYLWGLQVFGEQPGPFTAAIADFGDDGDRQGWYDFLALASTVFDRHGDIRLVHWTNYEKTQVTSYISRYGDVDGVADRVLRNLLDLHAVTTKSLALPDPSYSLKVVERRAGFTRSMEEYGGDWSMAQYIKAVETEDEALRSEVMEQIKQYNREDLEATWAVFQWLTGFEGS